MSNRKDLITQLIQHKTDINRILENKGSTKRIGFVLANGKTPSIYINDPSGPIQKFIRTDTGKHLLHSMKVIRETLNLLP